MFSGILRISVIEEKRFKKLNSLFFSYSLGNFKNVFQIFESEKKKLDDGFINLEL